MSEILMDDQAWPVFRVPFNDGYAVIVVYRNLPGDYGIDYLLAHRDWNRAQELASYDGDWSGPGLTWKHLLRITSTPDRTAPGAHDPAQRLLLLLPTLYDAELPAAAQASVEAALEAIGAPADGAPDTARALLDGRRHLEHVGISPLSGSGPKSEVGWPESPMLRFLNFTQAQHDALVRFLN